MIDIHTHILAGIDDGAKDLNTSILMIKEEIKDGVETIVLTPHFTYHQKNISYSTLKKHFTHLLEVTKDLPIKLILGSENYYNEKEKHLFKKMSLGESGYHLFEFSLYHDTDIAEILHELQVNGYKIILAHPERYQYLSWGKLLFLKHQNVLFQVNTASILGLNGSTIKKTAHRLLKMDLVDFIASDAHNLDKRKPNMLICFNYVKKKYGIDMANKLFIENQKKVLNF